MSNQDNQHHCYLSTVLSVQTGVPGVLSSWIIHWLFSNFTMTSKRLSLKDVYDYVLSRFNISFYNCDCNHSVFTNTPPKHYRHMDAAITTSIYSPWRLEHCVFHISLDFRHTYTHEFYPINTFHQKILFYSFVFVLSSKIYIGTIAQDFFLFQRNCQCFRNNSFVKAIFTQSSLNWPFTNWNWNRLIKSIHQIVQASSTILFYKPCLLVDLGRPVHGLFCIFPHWHCSNLLKILDTADRVFFLSILV